MDLEAGGGDLVGQSQRVGAGSAGLSGRTIVAIVGRHAGTQGRWFGRIGRLAHVGVEIRAASRATRRPSPMFVRSQGGMLTAAVLLRSSWAA
jgi:hypothetical protein